MIGRDARGDAKRGHGGEPRERDERAAAVVCGANEPYEIDVAKKRGISSPFAGENHQAEPARAKELIDGAERMHPALGPDEERPFFPERSGDRAGDVYPGRAITMRDCGTACRTHNGRRASARFPDREPAERKPSARERSVELGDPRDDRIGRMLRNLDSVWETLFEENTECGDLGRHGIKMIPNKHRINNINKSHFNISTFEISILHYLQFLLLLPPWKSTSIQTT